MPRVHSWTATCGRNPFRGGSSTWSRGFESAPFSSTGRGMWQVPCLFSILPRTVVRRSSMFRRTFGAAVLMLTVAASTAALVTSGSSGAASRRYTIAFAPASDETHDVYHLEMGKGGRAAAKAVGARYIFAPTPSSILGTV